MPKFTATLKFGIEDYTTVPKEFKDGAEAQKYWVNKVSDYSKSIESIAFIKPRDCAVVIHGEVLNKMIFFINEYTEPKKISTKPKTKTKTNQLKNISI